MNKELEDLGETIESKENKEIEADEQIIALRKQIEEVKAKKKAAEEKKKKEKKKSKMRKRNRQIIGKIFFLAVIENIDSFYMKNGLIRARLINTEMKIMISLTKKNLLRLIYMS